MVGYLGVCMQLTKHFSLKEFACNDADGTAVPAQYIGHVTRLAHQLQIIRDFFNAPVRINSGYRTKAYNAKVGGAADSQHLTASAADIVVTGFSALQVARAIEGLMRIGAVEQGGLGVYPDFVHLDIRGHKARW